MIGRIGLASATLAAVFVAGCGAESATGPAGGGVAGDSAAASPRAADAPTGLVGLWRVQASGEEPGVVVRLADGLALWRACGVLFGEWRANTEGRFVSHLDAWSGGCRVASDVDPAWLRRAVAYRPDGTGLVLLDDRGGAVARLLPGGRLRPRPEIAKSETEPPVLTDKLRKALAPAAPLPARLRPATPAQLVGRWVPADGAGASAPQQPHVQLFSDGRWGGSDGCNAQAGRWNVGAAGSLLAVAGPQTLIGCRGASPGTWLIIASLSSCTTVKTWRPRVMAGLTSTMKRPADGCGRAGGGAQI